MLTAQRLDLVQLFLLLAGSQEDLAVPGAHSSMAQQVWGLMTDDTNNPLQAQAPCHTQETTLTSGIIVGYTLDRRQWRAEQEPAATGRQGRWP